MSEKKKTAYERKQTRNRRIVQIVAILLAALMIGGVLLSAVPVFAITKSEVDALKSKVAAATAKKNDLKKEENLQYVLDRLDVDSMFDYVIYSMMIGNYDSGNVRYYRFPGGKWTFMLHDVEAGCMNSDEAPVNTFLRKKTASATKFPHWALAALLEVPEYKDKFLRRTAEIVQSNFLYSEQVEPIYEKWHAALSEILPRHIKKFRHFTFEEWNTNVHASMYYARIRPKKVIGLICTNLKVNSADKEMYFGETLDLLDIYNVKK